MNDDVGGYSRILTHSLGSPTDPGRGQNTEHSLGSPTEPGRGQKCVITLRLAFHCLRSQSNLKELCCSVLYVFNTDTFWPGFIC